MPYIHWEADRARLNIIAMIEEVKYESQRTAAAQKIKLWLNENDRDIRAFVEVAPDAREAEEDYSKLLKRYLFKRRPVHLLSGGAKEGAMYRLVSWPS